MQTFTANKAKTHFGELLDLAQREPVRVTRRDRIVGVMVSALAQQQGLTPEALDALLADES